MCSCRVQSPQGVRTARPLCMRKSSSPTRRRLPSAPCSLARAKSGRAPPAEVLLDLESESGAIHTPHKQKGQVQMTTPTAPEKGSELRHTPQPPKKPASGRKTPRKLARLQRKATFRRRRRSSAAAAPRAAATPELWRDRAEWGKLSKEEKLRHLPRVLSMHAEGKQSAHSFTIRRGQAAVECLLRERAFWCRAHQDGQWAEDAQRHFAWIKSGGPEAAFRLALAAAGAT